MVCSSVTVFFILVRCVQGPSELSVFPPQPLGVMSPEMRWRQQREVVSPHRLQERCSAVRWMFLYNSRRSDTLRDGGGGRRTRTDAHLPLLASHELFMNLSLYLVYFTAAQIINRAHTHTMCSITVMGCSVSSELSTCRWISNDVSEDHVMLSQSQHLRSETSTPTCLSQTQPSNDLLPVRHHCSPHNQMKQNN